MPFPPHPRSSPRLARRPQTRGMLETSTWLSLAGQTCKFPEGTKKISICVHGDFPGAVGVAQAVRRAIDDVKNGVPAQ
ncbi:hypothetical protein JCM21900_000189 [Sporobolomyces salmonicolor]